MAKTAELNHEHPWEDFILRTWLWMTGWILLGSTCALGCREPSPCEQEARRECEETLETINYFNKLAGRDAYTLEDCYKLIPYRCPDSF